LFRVGEPAGLAGFDALELGPELESVLVVEWGDLWSVPPRDHLRIRLTIEGEFRRMVASASGADALHALEAWMGKTG
jgi:tRNA A37 threonylcarbamoyladenosine biosynthesis protein TsaE